MGSSHVFNDQYLDKEENSKLQEVIFRWLTTDDITLNSIDADDPEVLYINDPALFLCCCSLPGLQVSDYHFLPDTAKRAERVKPCLQETEELPRDFTALFDHTLFKLDTEVLPEALE